MEVVLIKDHENLGKALDVVPVKDGYARNFLIPKGIAVPATEGNKKRVTQTREIEKIREDKKRIEAQDIASKIEQTPCTIPVKVGDEDKIFGSVSSQEIADFLQKEGFKIEKRDVNIDEPIKRLGVYTISITVYRSVTANLKVWVVKEE